MPKVGVVKTSPKTVFEDIARALDLAEYQKHVSKNVDTTIKLNLSWSKFYPACSTNPYIFDGLLRKMISDGYHPRTIQAVENETVVTNIYAGTKGNNALRPHERGESSPFGAPETGSYAGSQEDGVASDL